MHQLVVWPLGGYISPVNKDQEVTQVEINVKHSPGHIFTELPSGQFHQNMNKYVPALQSASLLDFKG